MDNWQQKLDNLTWLKTIGVEYYCSEEKDSKNSFIKLLKEQKNQKTEIVLEKEMLVTKQPKAIKEQKATNDNPVIAEARSLADKANSLDELKKSLESFNGCELKNFATNTVFADGVRNAPILLLGEAPGATEDQQGIPFCGESGRLLDKMLATVNISRAENAYITNSVFWRPPANRRPTPEEIEICRPFVEKHIALANPKFIILVGSTAVAALLGKTVPMAGIRRKIYPYTNQYLTGDIPTTVIFHPAYLLRQPMQKKTTWYDLLQVEEFIRNLS
jgi:DNA polymerase